MHTLQQLRNGELKGVVRLKLSENLSEFPQEIFELADTLEILDLTGNNLTALPADLGLLKKLRILFCSDNKFTRLPEELSNCPLLDIVGFRANLIEEIPPKSINPNLRWLVLTDNRIAEIPPEIGDCHDMQKLILAGNRLTALPQQLSNCKNLGLLRISANRLTALPEWLLAMPKLSWLAFSGNPFVKSPLIKPLELINWEDLQLNHILGQGASGMIYQAQHITPGGAEELAVKIFKGNITNDGLPEDELDSCIAAGTHSGLVRLVGQINAHPEGKKGLVMELIPDRFSNLGGPPSFASCTRDVFKGDFKITPLHAVKVATTIASVAAQLHSRGIMHGDLYAHNTMIDDEGNALFGDFGAATFYEDKLLEKIEVSAFGYLLDDLIGLCAANEEGDLHMDGDVVLEKLISLKNSCHLPEVALRPSFAHLHEELLAL